MSMRVLVHKLAEVLVQVLVQVQCPPADVKSIFRDVKSLDIPLRAGARNRGDP